jgi:hypothetical protein
MIDRVRGARVVDVTHTLFGERGAELQSRLTRIADCMPEGTQRPY